MPDLLYFILCGAGVGLAVGLTGVGGGSLMTPLLIFSGIPTKIAIGTDLLYAAATKSGALISHQRQQTIKWNVVLLLLAGSIPASLATSAALKLLIAKDTDYSAGLELALGIMLILTSIVVIFKSRIKTEAIEESKHNRWIHQHRRPVTFVAGILLGLFVTLSSVGAGAFCTALLLTLFPRLPALNVIGTDIAHAVPLTLVAGLGHVWNESVSWSLLAGLLMGSLPAVHFGAKLASKIPNHILQRILAFILFGIGLKFVFIS
ncbi:sulfite exporter TauE/SafE family protein [Agaribacterium sp. ZY112]|uniref:sulfite exporter TauE/SafE family protein n=1 Tax=Agaribacterium sp. ZY112 TaxID=3233574 RepID=UPI0035260170